MKQALLIIGIFITTCIQAQSIIDFEEFDLTDIIYLNNAAPESYFVSQSALFENSYDLEFNFWSGWSITSGTDTTTEGFTNQYSAITGAGNKDSKNYAISFVLSETQIKFEQKTKVKGMSITNATYPYLSMLNGDGFAKKFGGETGNDPDFFKLTIKGYADGALLADSVEVLLADYSFEDNTLDYILKDWKYADLDNMPAVDSLSFFLSSSDVGDFGMNTPAYFCIDDLTLDLTSQATLPSENYSINIVPNPSFGLINMETTLDNIDFKVFDIFGKMLQETKSKVIDLSSLHSGEYIIQTWKNGTLLKAQKVIYTR